MRSYGLLLDGSGGGSNPSLPKPCRRERLPRTWRNAGLVAPLHIRVVGGNDGS